MSSPLRWFQSCALLGVLAAAPAFAAAPAQAPPATVAVDFAAEEHGDAWFAAALEASVAGELARFHRVALADKPAASRCPGRERACLVSAAREAGVEVLVSGTLRGARLTYDVSETWTGARAFGGSLGLEAGLTSAVLQQRLGAIVRPIVQSGGLLDEKPAPRPAEAAPAAPAPEGPLGALLLPLCLVALMLFVAWPPALAVLLVGRAAFRKGARPRSWALSALLLAALGAALAAALRPELREAVARQVAALTALAPALRLGAPVAGGLLWGGFALVLLRALVPQIQGLRQVRHDALWPLLRAWVALAGLRGLLLLAWAPLLWLTHAACAALGLEERLTLGLAVPAAGLLGALWFLTLVDNLALYLDTRLVEGPASARNPWHATYRRYFLGYVRRLGVDVGGRLDQVLFLPRAAAVHGQEEPWSVTSYGGGLSRPRVLVDAAASDLALGELPDETPMPERTVNGEELPLGLLVPGPAPAADGEATHLRRQRGAAARPRGPAPRLVGQNATLLGWLVPTAADASVPLISNNPEDFDVVRSLLTEHYAAFEKNLDEDEHDDTDPSQKDFLFGPLLREVGAVLRGDGQLSTVRLALALATARASWLSRRLLKWGFAFSARFLAAPAATLADASVALNRGLDHLIQYLWVADGGAAEPLTARANAPQLLRTSRELLQALGGRPSRQLLRATPRTRLERLAACFYSPIAPPPRRRVARVLLALAVALAAFAGVGSAVAEALDYHPVYQERMRAQDEARSQAVQQEQGAANGEERSP